MIICIRSACSRACPTASQYLLAEPTWVAARLDGRTRTVSREEFTTVLEPVPALALTTKIDTSLAGVLSVVREHREGIARIELSASMRTNPLDLLASFLVDILEGAGELFGHYLHVRLYENFLVVAGDIADLELTDA